MITNARFTRDDPPELEVAWNGVNDGHDGDLLCPERRQAEKSDGVPRPPHDGSVRETIRAALPTIAREAVTFRELVVITGCLPAAVNSALYLLRQAGLLHSEALPGGHGDRARPPQRYWRRA